MSRQGLSEFGGLSLPHPPIATASLSRLLVGGVRWGTNMGTSFCQVVVSGLRRVNARVTSGPRSGSELVQVLRRGPVFQRPGSVLRGCGMPVSGIVVRTLIVTTRAYSARRNGVRGPPAYSPLKPGTSSESPPGRSGARLGPARMGTNRHSPGCGEREGPGRPRVVTGVESVIRSARGGGRSLTVPRGRLSRRRLAGLRPAYDVVTFVI